MTALILLASVMAAPPQAPPVQAGVPVVAEEPTRMPAFQFAVPRPPGQTCINGKCTTTANTSSRCLSSTSSGPVRRLFGR